MRLRPASTMKRTSDLALGELLVLPDGSLGLVGRVRHDPSGELLVARMHVGNGEPPGAVLEGVPDRSGVLSLGCDYTLRIRFDRSPAVLADNPRRVPAGHMIVGPDRVSIAVTHPNRQDASRGTLELVIEAREHNDGDGSLPAYAAGHWEILDGGDTPSPPLLAFTPPDPAAG